MPLKPGPDAGGLADKHSGASMRIRRLFTIEGKSPYEGIAFRSATSEIRNPDGSVVFRQSGIEVPEAWSQVACDVLAQKYFRRAGRRCTPEAGRREHRPLVPVAPGAR